MKLSSVVALAALAASSSAEIERRDHWQSVECPGEVTVTVTQTLPAAGAPSPTDGSGSGSGSGSGYGSGTSGGPPAAVTHKVDVGAAGELVFGPDQVEAAVGDVVEFNFLKLNHSVTQSNFATPCTFNGGFDTGLNQFNPQNISGKFVKSFTVTDTKPTWFYCKQSVPASHCGKGMVFGINPAGKMEQFIDNAEKQKGGNVVTVTVGLDHGKTLKFDPPFLERQSKDDTIVFDFRFKNHTLTESSFEHPCTKLEGTSIDTDFKNVNVADVAGQNTTSFRLDTDEKKPRWFYCKQGNGTPQGHCAKGMVFGINTNQAKFDEFVERAKATLPTVKGRSLGPLGRVF